MRSLFLALGFAACISPLAADTPRGKFVELHSCELFTGGCTASAEVTLKGRYSLTVWQFENTGLKNLVVAVAQVGDENIADSHAAADGVLYLPENASDAQRAELSHWVISEMPKVKVLKTRIVPMQFQSDGVNVSFRAGNAISVATGPILACGMGSCGESLWYQPRVKVGLFTVATVESSSVLEPALQLKWKEVNRRNVFIGSFDSASSAKAKFTRCEELCGSLTAAR